MSNKEVVTKLNDFFKTLGDPTRMRIILLLQNNPLSVTDIARKLNMEQSAISHQLKILYNERFVTFTRDGKARIYEILDNHIYAIIKQASEHLAE